MSRSGGGYVTGTGAMGNVNHDDEVVEVDDRPSTPPIVRVVTYEKPDATPSGFDLSFGAPENFPILCFPPLLRSVAQDMANVYQTPVCLPAMAALAVASGAVAKSCVVVGGYKDRSTRLNLYVIPVAERGSGKGVIGEKLCEPISQESHELAKRHRQIVATQRGEIGVLKREAQQLEIKATRSEGAERANLLDALGNRHERLAELENEAARDTTLLVGDTTSEALGRALADNGETLFTYSSEGGGAVKVALGKYSDQGDYDLLLSGYSGDAVRTNRITRRAVQLESPCLSLLWLVQPCVMRMIVSDAEAFARGLTARPLIFDTGSRREHDDRKNLAFTQGDNWRRFIAKILVRRLQINSQPVEIACSAEAREVFAKFYDESINLERGPFADLAGELSRWRENALKVAGLFAVAEDVGSISPALAERAVSVVRWCGFNYLGLLQSGRRERLREELEGVQKLLREHDGSLSLGTLVRSHGIKRPELEALIAAFPGLLTIDRIPQKEGAGRPAEVLRATTNSTLSTK
jgi:hypothetical protein